MFLFDFLSHDSHSTSFPSPRCLMLQIIFLQFGTGMFWPKTHCFITPSHSFILFSTLISYLYSFIYLFIYFSYESSAARPRRTLPRHVGWHFQWKDSIVDSQCPSARSIKQWYQLPSPTTSTTHRDTGRDRVCQPSSPSSRAAGPNPQAAAAQPSRRPFFSERETLIIAAAPPRKRTNNWLCIYFPGETGQQTSAFSTPPPPTHTLQPPPPLQVSHHLNEWPPLQFPYFPQDIAINVDGWFALSMKQGSWAHCQEKFDSCCHLFATCLFLQPLYPLLLSLKSTWRGKLLKCLFWAAALTLPWPESQCSTDVRSG